ncbi:MAG: CHAT domain-containing protein [Ilumatobacteraceae bacterium]
MADVPQAGISEGRRLDELVQSDPRATIEVARAWLVRSGGDEHVEALANMALGRALFELGRMPAALTAMRTALRAASATADAELAVRVTMSAAAIMAEAGAVDEALALLDEIESSQALGQRGRFETQRLFVCYHAGRLHEALVHGERAEPMLRTDDDQLGLLRLLLNRGLVHLQQGSFDRAAGDFAPAEQLAIELGQSVIRATVVANQAVALGRARRIPQSLDYFARAAELFERAGLPDRSMSIMEIDRAEVLMHAGLTSDAVTAAGRALRLVEPTGNEAYTADAHLLLARAELADRRYSAASATAARAAERFVASSRLDMAPLARSVSVQADMLGQSDRGLRRELVEEAGAVRDALIAAGWNALADELRVARIRAGRTCDALVDVIDDADHLRAGVAAHERNTALAGWWAEAVGNEYRGDRRAATNSCHSGLLILDGIVAEATSLEERSAAMRMGNDLSQLLIEFSVAESDADTALAAAEGTRARALHDELIEPDRHQPLTTDGAARLRTDLIERLGDRTLVEWIVVGEEVWAVVLTGAGSRLARIGGYREVVRARDRIVVWLDVAAAEPEQTGVLARRAAQLLDDLLIAPLQLPPATGVVIVPVDLLHGIPWSGLPSLVDRPVVLAPNAQVWLGADRRSTHVRDGVGLVIGPDLDRTEIERDAVERHHGTVTVASGRAATPHAVAAMFETCDVVHIAAHGTFRSDHPLLSTLRLADGDATMYDAVPDLVRSRLVILSSCEGGAQGTADGSEVLGLSAVLLARGAAAVLAPLTVVRELECAAFVAEVHGELAAGEPFACAVAAVRSRWLATDSLSRWAVASSFTCFGSGAVTIREH